MLESIEPTAASPDEGPSVLLGRQPIVDRTGALVAYELLFHGHDGTGDSIPADDPAATDARLDALLARARARVPMLEGAPVVAT